VPLIAWLPALVDHMSAYLPAVGLAGDAEDLCVFFAFKAVSQVITCLPFKPSLPCCLLAVVPAGEAEKESWAGKHPWQPWDRDKDLEVQLQRPKAAGDLLKAAGNLSSRFSSGGR
jgi:hypothetical protein